MKPRALGEKTDCANGLGVCLKQLRALVQCLISYKLFLYLGMCMLLYKYYALFYSLVDINHSRIPSTVSNARKEWQQTRTRSQTFGHGFSPPCWEKMQMNAIGLLFFFPFLKKNQEISEMHLEGNGERVKEIKPGENSIILYI